MAINLTKRGLRLGYLIRGRYHDAAGVAQTLRLSGPASRVATGYVGPDPDGTLGAREVNHWWRAGVADPSLREDLGKLNQHIATLNRLTLKVALDYPINADSEVVDTSLDAALRAAAVGGRWANRDVDLWLIDLDTEDTEHRFAGTWDNDATSVEAGTFALSAVEEPGILGSVWKMAQVPHSTSAWTPAATLNSANLYRSPSTASSGRGFELAPDSKGKWLGSVFGYDDSAATSTTPAPVWRQVVYYGGTTGYGAGTIPIGNTTDPVYWFWVSPQYGCTVGSLRVVDDDGAIHENGGGVILITGLVGHNYDPARGPLGTFIAVQFDLSGGEAFSFTDNSNVAWARVNGPGTGGATQHEWHVTYGEPFTYAFGNGATPAAVERVPDVIDLVISDAEYLGASILGTTAIADFAAANPSGVGSFARVLAAVPITLTDEPITYREALTGLVAGLPADLVWRFDAAAQARRLFPRWRGPRPGDVADWTIRASDLASLAPRPSVRQQNDPFGEYSNETTVVGPDYIDQPSSVPFAGNDTSLLSRANRHGRRISDPVEQSAARHAGIRDGRRTWSHWSPKNATGANESARYIAAEVDQQQVWTTGTAGGGAGLRLQLSDLIGYKIHGITEAVGQIRTLDHALESQTVEVTAVHIIEYEADAGGGD